LAIKIHDSLTIRKYSFWRCSPLKLGIPTVN
jgi:hypothetical protein